MPGLRVAHFIGGVAVKTGPWLIARADSELSVTFRPRNIVCDRATPRGCRPQSAEQTRRQVRQGRVSCGCRHAWTAETTHQGGHGSHVAGGAEDP